MDSFDSSDSDHPVTRSRSKRRRRNSSSSSSSTNSVRRKSRRISFFSGQTENGPRQRVVPETPSGSSSSQSSDSSRQEIMSRRRRVVHETSPSSSSSGSVINMSRRRVVGQTSPSSSSSDSVINMSRRRVVGQTTPSSSSSGSVINMSRRRVVGQTSPSSSSSESVVNMSRRRVVHETSSSEDSDAILTTRRVRRLRGRVVVFDNDDSDSDNSNDAADPITQIMTRNLYLPSTNRASSVMRRDEEGASSAGVAAMEAAGDASDSGEEGGHKCAICLRSIRSQEIGSPEACDHTFCLVCIVTWSKNCNRCPLDRQPFKIIFVRENLQGPVTRQLEVEERVQPVVFDEEDPTFCIICGGFNHEDRMLLCDGCDRGFHIDCLSPPLESVPEQDLWFCPNCEEPTIDEPPTEQRRQISLRSRLSRLRLHTIRISSRVSDQILEQFQRNLQSSSNRARAAAEEAPSTSGTQPIRTPKKPAVKRKAKKKVKKKRKVVRRRYVKKKVTVENEDGTITEEVYTEVVRRRKKRKITKKRKKTKSKSRPSRSTATSRNSSRPSVRERLARALLKTTPKTTKGQPVAASCPRPPPTNSIFTRGLHILNIFEPRNELAPVSSCSEDEIGGGEVGLMSRARSIRPRPLERRKAVELFRTATARPRPVIEPSEGSSDLLSSILESQAIWHSKSSDVTVHNDGSVQLPPRNRVDVRNAEPERVVSAAPMYPGSGARHFGSGANRPPPSSTQSRPDAPLSSGSRLGAPYNDREGYTNYLNSISPRPTLFCRGGPPLSFRMPVRPQLRRIPLLPRRPSRALYDNDDDDDDDNNNEGSGENKVENDGDSPVDDIGDKVENEPKLSEQDVDLYSDIEPNTDRDGIESEGVIDYPTLGPPPEPPAFLLNMAKVEEKKSESDVYDPAEPCDSDEELVIDESKTSVQPLPPPPSPPLMLQCSSVVTTEKQIVDDCPLLNLYSSDSLAFSRKDEDERARDLAAKDEKQDEDVPPCPTDEMPQSPQLARADENTHHTRKLLYSDGNDEHDSSPKRSPSPSPTRSNTRQSPKHLPISKKDRTPSFKSESSPSPALTNPDSDEEDKTPKSPRAHGGTDFTDTSSKENINQFDEDLPRVSTGLEGLDVEEVSSDMEENDLNNVDRLSDLSLSGITDRSRLSSPVRKKKKSKKRAKIKGKSKKATSEDGEIASDRERHNKSENSDENKIDNDADVPIRQTEGPNCEKLSSQENKTNVEDKETWKKLPKKSRNYRESRKVSSDRSKEKRKGGSLSPKRDKKKTKKDEKKKNIKKKEIERYDVRKVVKDKEMHRKDEFGRDLPVKSHSRSKSRSLSRALDHQPSRSPSRHSRSPGRRRSRSTNRRLSRSPVRKTSRSPGKRNSRSPVRRMSRSSIRRLSRSPLRRSSRSPVRRGRRKRSYSRSPLSPRRRRRRSTSDGKRVRRSRGRKSRSASRSPRRRPKPARTRNLSRSISLSPPPRRGDFSPARFRRSVSPVSHSRAHFQAWSPRPPIPRDKSLENLTVVLTSKDKRKKKKKKDERRDKKVVEGRKKKSSNSKEVFASGDNVLVSVNFSKSNKSNVIVVPPDLPIREVSKKKKKRSDDTDKTSKKSKTSNSGAKIAVETVLNPSAQKRKKLTRLTEEDAEVILNRKPVAVIDLDMSPYREQTPSPINVVIVSDSGSGDECKAPSQPQQQQCPRTAEVIVLPAPTVPHVAATTGPKTPPEPAVKFSIMKPLQIRPIANPLADADDGPEECLAQNDNQVIENTEIIHKGPNTPPGPRGPSTPPRGPTTPPMVGLNTSRSQSPQSTPDAYDPFEPTKSRSPSPVELPIVTDVDKPALNDIAVQSGAGGCFTTDDTPTDGIAVTSQEPTNTYNPNDGDISTMEVSEIVSSQNQNYGKAVSAKKSTPQPMTPSAGTTLPVFSLPSPKTPNRSSSITAAVSGLQRLQHRLGSPVSKTPNSVKSTPEKRNSDSLSIQRGKKNGALPIVDVPCEPIDMDDSPYSPGSSEGDDLFDPPPAPQPTVVSHPPPPPQHKPPKSKSATLASAPTPNKFDSLFGSLGSSISPLKNGAKKPAKILKASLPKALNEKKGLKAVSSSKKNSQKMDEDQLRILDEVPSSAVELQVKDKYLKKLNRQERVVDEVKTVLKPHYAKKHITKDEYKQILRRAVPKVCHSKGGEINPSKIQHLVEAYVRKYRQVKKKTTGGIQKHPKFTKTALFS